jgi:phospholipase/carboxylesterase
MNRIQRWPAETVESTPPVPAVSRVEQSVLQLSQQRDLAYALFAPLHYEPNYGYPLLVWLHGPGDDERQLCRVMPHISLRNYVGVGPRGCCAPVPGGLGFRWQQHSTAIQTAEQHVFDGIEVACQRYHIDPMRIFLAGYQCGGTMALRLALQHPCHFAGVLSLGGSFPTGLAPLAQLRRIRQLPIFIAQGRDSESYPQQQCCDELRLFHAAALHVTLRQYPCQDELTTQMLHDMDVWIMERINGVSAASSHDVHAFPGDAS